MTCIVQSIAGIQNLHGGTSRSVPALSESLARLGHKVHLVSGRPVDRSLRSNQPNDSVHMHWIEESQFTGRLLTGRAFRKTLSELAAQGSSSTVIHDHGLWLPSNHAVAQFAKREHLLRIVSPRGMLSNWAMNHRKWKKSLFWNLFQFNDLQNASAFHATSDMEAKEIRSLGLNQPIAVLPNGITFPEQLETREKGTPRRCLFLSRIHAKKGLSLLLNAWKKSGPPEGWMLVIAGTDEKNHLSQLRKETVSLGLENSVQFPGPVDDIKKWELYQSSELFVLPSFSENFGIVVAESLAAGVPVITTTGTPWSSLEERDSGWWVEPTADSFADAIRHAVSMPKSELKEMGSRGSRWIRSEYQWDAIACRMSQYYQWLIHGGSRPEFVV